MKSMIKTIFFTFSLSILFCVSAYAQPVFMIEDQSVESTATTLTVPVQVVNFTNIAGVQFSINWDTDVLSLSGIDDNFGLPSMSVESNFGQMEAANGKLGFFWFNPPTTGLDLDDDTAIFTLEFDVVQPITETTVTEIGFGGSPTSIEVTDGNSEIESTFGEGTMVFNYETTAVFNTAPHIVQVSACSPNPIKDVATLEIDLIEAADVQLSIISQDGKIVTQRKQSFLAGQSIIELDKSDFTSSGVYYIELVSSSFKTSQKVLFVGE